MPKHLILFRYLSRQVLQITLAVTFVLLVVALTSRFIQYLSQAVAGELASDVLFLLMFYRLPDFLLVIVPLALFLSILLAHGRMYADNEMVVLLSSGFSQFKLLLMTQAAACFVLVFMAAVSLWLAPWGVRNTELLKQNQEQLTEIDLVTAGQFQAFGDGRRVTYAESIVNNGDTRRLGEVFVAISSDKEGEELQLILADSASPQLNTETGARFMRLDNVMQYEGIPGQGDFTIGQFDNQSILLPDATEFEEILEEATLTTSALMGSAEPKRQAELQWRLSILLLIPIITLIAVPLAKVNPREGRYSKLLPAFLLYAVYFVLLQVARDAVADGAVNATLGVWWVHVLFLVIGGVVYRYPDLSLQSLLPKLSRSSV